MQGLYDYVFHFNTYEKMWCAIPRNKYTDHFGLGKSEGILRSKSIETLIDIIARGDEFISSIPQESSKKQDPHY